MGIGSSVVARTMVVALLAMAMVGCGGKDGKSTSTASATAGAKSRPRPSETTTKDERMANAVAAGKTGAAVDLLYDLLAKPVAAQPFEIELAVTPQVAADALDIEAHGMPGLDVVAGGTASFQNVVAGERYTAKVLVRPAADGIYYVVVTAKLISKVQTDSRAFSVPVVVGETPAAQPAAAAAAGQGTQTVKSMPAEETGRK